MISPTKAIFSYRALFRSLWRYDWESEWREHLGAHSVSAHPDKKSCFSHILQELHQHESERSDVILPAFGCQTLVTAVQQAGLSAKLVDMEPMAPIVSMSTLRGAINEQTLAVVTTNLFGAVDPVEDIAAICRENGVFLVEDISMALGCDSNNRELGQFGDVVFLSFGLSDVITTMNGAIACWRNSVIGRSDDQPAILGEFDWRIFLSLAAYPYQTKPSAFKRNSKISAQLSNDQDTHNTAGRSQWTLQQARLSALLLPLVEDEAGQRRENCRIIKRYQSEYGYDMVSRETNPKLTQYPCLAASEAHRDEILDRLEKNEILGGRGPGKMETIVAGEHLPNAAILLSRLYTLPCHPDVSEEVLNRMLSQVNQSNNAFVALVKERYSNLVERYGSSQKSNGQGKVSFRIQRKLIADQLRKLPGGDISVLDSGCGNGALGPVFRKFMKVACLDGVDFVPKSLEIAKTDYGYSRTYLTSVMSIDTALGGKKYDLVNASDIIPYIPPEKYLHFFKAHRRCVSDGRHFLLTLPNSRSIYQRAFKSKANLRYNFSPVEVLEALSESGFNVVMVVGSDMFGALRFKLNTTLAPSLKQSFSSEISILCEAC